MGKRGRLLLAAALCSVGAIASPAQAQLLGNTLQTLTSPPATVAPVKPYYRNIRPFYRNIRAFWGDVNPFYRNIRAFWGDVDPFYRNIRAFWGEIDPIVYAQIAGAPQYEKLGPFWDDLGNDWSVLSASWQTGGAYSLNTGKYGTIAQQLTGIVGKSEALWGSAVRAKTGKSFMDGFARPIFTRFGIDPNDPASLARLSAEEQSHFFIDWYDGLMGYAGVDHADHWMKTVNWTPRLTQAQGDGQDAVIGLLDFVVAGDADIRNNVVSYNGVSNYTNGHGAGVASLMVSAHDGKGIMGIAPSASVVAFNPFDDTGTADWSDITRGIGALHRAGAGVMNMSLGESGWTLEPSWRSVFSSNTLSAILNKAVFVKAAGNDGITQTRNIAWDWLNNPALLVVGSVDPTGRISDFSNRPGEACLLNLLGGCEERNKLKYRFLVAPGELILVSDDQGGVVRQSGTSFSAPLVSGAVALILDRWPWLASHPHVTADIILSTARDLGAPGVDPVYGRGLLDVEAAQSPRNFNTLVWYQSENGVLRAQSVSAVQSTVNTRDTAKWNARNMYFYAFEKLALGVQRDFAIPLASKLVDQTIYVNGSNERFQAYLYDRMVDWADGPGFTNMRTFTSTVPNRMGLNLTMSAAPRNANLRFRQGDAPFQSALRLSSESGRLGVTFGHGDGAMVLGGQRGFGLFSSYDPQTGGVNPVLGMASGGLYARADYRIADGLTLAAGATGRTLKQRRRDLLNPQDLALAGVADYKARGAHVTLAYRIDPRIGVTAAYTQVKESSALLGVQSLDPADFADGATTDGLTLGFDYWIGGSVTLSASATAGRTRSGDTDRQSIAVGSGGMISSAYEVALAKQGILGRADKMRVSVTQPMHVEKGRLDYSIVKVIDRNTGEIGVVTESIALASRKRSLFSEVLYAAPLFGAGELSAFGRVQLRGDAQDALDSSVIVGGRFKTAF